MMRDYLRIAVGNMREKRVRSWLTLIGIFIGVAALVSLVGLGQGLRTAITSQFGISSTQLITVQASGVAGSGPPGTGVSRPLVDDDVEAIERLSTVEVTAGRLISQFKLEYNDRVNFGVATSIPDGRKRDFVYDSVNLELEKGRLLKDGDNNKVVLGYNFFADNTGLGEPVDIGKKVIIDNEKFKVVGLAAKQGSFIFDNIILLNEDVFRELSDNDEKVDLIAVKVKDKDLMDEAQQDIEKLMRDRRDVKKGQEDFTVSTPDASLSTVNNILTGIQVFVGIIAGISILVGSIGIVNTMLTSVLERRRQIGIMKSIGARNGDIFFLFFIESGLMGLLGGIIGTTIGSIVAYVGTTGINNWIGSSASPEIDFLFIGITLAGSFLIGAISGVAPALKAAWQNPVEALEG
ncbi:MAG: ABC transporter permease [Nanoarchaeota archaeon]